MLRGSIPIYQHNELDDKDKEITKRICLNNDYQRNCNNYNNEVSFDTSQLDMRQTCKFKPPLNMANLPSVFEMPKMNYNSLGGYCNHNVTGISNMNVSNNNINPPIRYSKNNLQPMKHVVLANYKIVEDNPIERDINIRKPLRPQLKPINIKDPRRNRHIPANDYTINNINNNSNSDKELLLALANKHLRYKSLEKFAKTSEYYYQMLQKLEPEQYRIEIIKLEKKLKDEESSSAMNKSMIDKKNIFNHHNQSPKEMMETQQPPKKELYTVYNTYNNPNQPIEKYAYCVNEFISISSSNGKVLHIPTMRIYNMQRIPQGINREEYINDWKALDHSVLEIIAVFKDYPKGYDSVVTEIGANGSIENIVKTMGAIDEQSLQGIVIQLIPLIEYYNIRIGNHYSFLSLENICFDYKGNVVLYPALERNDHEMPLITKLKEEWRKVARVSKSKLHMKIDLFNLGMMLLDIHLAIIDSKVNDFISNFSSYDFIVNNEHCCLYHYLLKTSNEFNSIINNPSWSFSQEYLSFLCHLTSFEFTSSFSINKTKREDWLQKKYSLTPLYTIRNVIKTGKLYDFVNEYYTPNSQIRNFDLLCEEIDANLPYCEEYFNFYAIKNSNAIFNNKQVDYGELAKKLRIDFDTLEKRLLPIYANYFAKRKVNFL